MKNLTPEEKTAIPVEKFGKDHWSTFAYVETRCVDHKGYLNNDHMRTDFTRHPFRVGQRKAAMSVPGVGSKTDGANYPTRLKGYFEDKAKQVVDHDDWDCIEDLIAAGLLMEPPDEGTGLIPCYRLTVEGNRVASELRTYKANGGNFATFEPTFEESK